MTEYILVTNYWNEHGNLRPLIEHIAEQTIRPVEWLFIDDGTPMSLAVDCNSEIMEACAKFDISAHYIYNPPSKERGDKLTIGRAWNKALPFIKEAKANYLAVTDIDARFPREYFAAMMVYLNTHPHVGVAAGHINGERRYDHMPMGVGKVVRWRIIEQIEEFWDLASDTFFNIKSMALGFINKSLDIMVESGKTTPRMGHDIAHRLQYCGNSWLTAFFKALRLRDSKVLTHFLRLRRRAHQCEDPDVRYYYSKRRILKSLFMGKVWVL